MLVSLGIIALNEESYLPELLEDIISQSFPLKNIDLLLIDSISTDKTKEIMEEFRQEHTKQFHNIRVLENAGKWQANGWNVFINHADGDILIKVDAHSHIPEDFVTSLVEGLENSEYGVLGGKRPTILKDNSLWSRILLEAENALFGSGIAIFRTSDTPRLVKSVFHGAYKKEVFRIAGVFDEKLRRTEDNEIHYRILKHGFKIMYNPGIISYQYARPTLRKMIKQKFLNGYWIGKTAWYCPNCLSLYHFIPFCFVLSLLVSSVLVVKIPFFLICLGTMYGLFDVLNSFISILKHKNVAMLVLMFLFPMLHIAYGLGTLLGLVSKRIK